jgi:uncharacterized protein YjeT (DUF2065 family)
MKQAQIRNSKAFMRTGLTLVIVVVLVVFVLLLSIFPTSPRRFSKALRITCANNLREIGLAHRVWANDHNGHYPTSEPSARFRRHPPSASSFRDDWEA